jgi:hypothetical protein
MAWPKPSTTTARARAADLLAVFSAVLLDDEASSGYLSQSGFGKSRTHGALFAQGPHLRHRVRAQLEDYDPAVRPRSWAAKVRCAHPACSTFPAHAAV